MCWSKADEAFRFTMVHGAIAGFPPTQPPPGNPVLKAIGEVPKAVAGFKAKLTPGHFWG